MEAASLGLIVDSSGPDRCRKQVLVLELLLDIITLDLVQVAWGVNPRIA
jgi:hypothetical protein